MKFNFPRHKLGTVGSFLLLATITFGVSKVSLVLPAQAAPKKMTNGLRQNKMLCIEGTSDLFANFKGIATCNAIHIRSRMGGSIWKEVSANKVTRYNNENRVYFVENIEAFLTDLNQDFRPIAIEEWEPPHQTVFDGRPAMIYKGFANLGKMGRQHVADVTCIENDLLSPAAHRMWCRFLGLNRWDIGIPVLLVQRRAPVLSATTKVVRLGQPRWCKALTTSTIREQPIDKNGFSVEPSWKQAKDRGGLYFSKDGNLKASEIDEFFRSDKSRF